MSTFETTLPIEDGASWEEGRWVRDMVDTPVVVEYDLDAGDPGCRTLPNGDPGWPGTGPVATITSCRKLDGTVLVLSDKDRETLEDEAVEHATVEEASAEQDEADAYHDMLKER